MARKETPKPKTGLSKAMERALKRAYKVAKRTARMHGIPLAVWKDGKVVLEKP